MTEDEIRTIRAIVYGGKRDNKSLDDIFWFLHSDEARIAIETTYLIGRLDNKYSDEY